MSKQKLDLFADKKIRRRVFKDCLTWESIHSESWQMQIPNDKRLQHFHFVAMRLSKMRRHHPTRHGARLNKPRTTEIASPGDVHAIVPVAGCEIGLHGLYTSQAHVITWGWDFDATSDRIAPCHLVQNIPPVAISTSALCSSSLQRLKRAVAGVLWHYRTPTGTVSLCW